MGVKDIRKANKVTVELGGKEWELKYPVRAFRELQERFGGWRAAWKKMAGLDKEGDSEFELDYDALGDFLEIGIHNAEASKAKIREWVDELMQDEVKVLIVAINEAKLKWSPEAKETEDRAGGDPQS